MTAYEKPCIAALWRSPEAVETACTLNLRPEAFTDADYAAAFTAILSCREEGLSDEVEYSLRLLEAYPDNGHQVEASVNEAVHSVESIASSKVWLRHLAQAWAERRKLQAVEQAYTSIKQGDVISDVVQRLSETIYEVEDSVKVDAEKQKEWQVKIATEIADRIRGGTANLTPTNIPEWDNLLGSFRNHEFILIGARPAVGKSSLARELMIAQVKHARRPVLLLSLEMGIGEVVQALASMSTGISGFNIERDFPERQQKLIETAEKITHQLGKLFLIRDDVFALRDIEEVIRRTIRAQKPSLVIIDYLQLIDGNPTGKLQKVHEIGNISRRLKQIASVHKTPIVALSQLNRDIDKSDRLPRLSDLRDSGSLEQDADRIVFIHGDSEDENLIRNVKLIQAKFRSGPCRTIDCWFHRATTRFLFTPPETVGQATVKPAVKQTSLQMGIKAAQKAQQTKTWTNTQDSDNRPF
jgi:replicative DNA helicase